MFATQRLRLRAYKSTDFQAIFDVHNTFGNMIWSHGTAHVVPESEDNFKNGLLKLFLSSEQSLMYCIVEELETGAFVGSVLLYWMQPKNRSAMFGISLHQDFQNKGYGTEITRFVVNYAFHNLGLHRLTLTVFGGNDRAIAAYKKAGFVVEVAIRKAVWINGEWHDEIRMGILEEEWRANRSHDHRSLAE